MGAVQPFTFPVTQQTVRSLLIDGAPWFVAVDVATILGYTNTRKAITDHVPARHRKGNDSFPLADLGLHPQTVLISEPGLYRLVMRSNAPLAEPFQDWVTDEVLPAIRENGSYGTSAVAALSNRDLARMVIEEADRADAAERRAAEMEPSARAWDVLASGQGDYSVGDAAKVLARDPSISLGSQRLFTTLRDLGWIYRQRSDNRWRAYQRAVETGWLAELPQKYEDGDGELVLTAPQVRVTPKGLRELHSRLGGSEPLQIGGAS